MLSGKLFSLGALLTGAELAAWLPLSPTFCAEQAQSAQANSTPASSEILLRIVNLLTAKRTIKIDISLIYCFISMSL